MPVLEVGKPYVPGRESWPEGSELNWSTDGLELRLFFAAPSAREVEAVRKGRAEFALTVQEGVIFLLFQFGGAVPWSDASFQWWLVPADRRQPGPVLETTQTRLLLRVLLVDATTGVLRVIRAVTLSSGFSRALAEAIAAQAAAPDPGRAAHDAAVDRIYARFPRTAAMLAVASQRCEGGKP